MIQASARLKINTSGHGMICAQIKSEVMSCRRRMDLDITHTPDAGVRRCEQCSLRCVLIAVCVQNAAQAPLHAAILGRIAVPQVSALHTEMPHCIDCRRERRSEIDKRQLLKRENIFNTK